MSRMSDMERVIVEMTQRKAIRKIAEAYRLIRQTPVTAEHQAMAANVMAELVKHVDPTRCRALVVLAVSDPTEGDCPNGERPEDNIKHTVMHYGHSSLVDPLLAAAHAGMMISVDDEAGPQQTIDQLTELLRKMGMSPSDITDGTKPTEH